MQKLPESNTQNEQILLGKWPINRVAQNRVATILQFIKHTHKYLQSTTKRAMPELVSFCGVMIFCALGSLH